MELGRPDRERDQPPPRRVKPPEMGVHGQAQHHQPPPPQKCPRCDSNNTKFCYYNNYSLSQPRYFCKGCRRYWTHGGTLRNVPVGGGCRKSKRPKQSTAVAAASSSGVTQPSSMPSIPGSMNPTAGILSGQSLIRALPPVMPSIGNSFYTGGGVLSSLGAIQTLPAGIMSQAPPVNFTGAGASGHYGANMAILRGLNLPSLKSSTPLQFQSPNDLFPSQQSFNFPARPLNPWTTQGFLSRDQASTSSNNTMTNFWNGSATDGGSSSGNINPGGSSFPHNRWTDKHLGFDPSE